MTELQKRYFEELARRRKVIADALDDPAAGGLREGTSDKGTVPSDVSGSRK